MKQRHFSLLMVFILAITMVGCTNIKTGYEGHMYKKFGADKGLNTNLTYSEGTHTIAPWNDMVKYSIREQSRTYDSEVLDATGLEVQIKFTVNFRPVRGKTGEIHLTYGEDYAQRLIDPIAFGAVKDVTGKFKAEELYSTKREALETEISTIIEEAIEAEGLLEFRFVEISDVDLPATITKAIEAKEAQEQRNQKAEKFQAEKEFIANALVAEADGKYKASIKDAKANREIANSVTPNLIRWRQLDVQEKAVAKWNGQRPKVEAGGTGGILLEIDTQ